MRNRKAAMEMSVGTIVTIVLLMTVLILGLALVKNIFKGGTEIVSLTNEQLRNEVGKLFSEDAKIVIYPTSRHVHIKQGTQDGVGIGIKNLIKGAAASQPVSFSYEVINSDPDIQRKCGISGRDVESYIAGGRAEDNILISSGDFFSGRVLFSIPETAPLCTTRFRVNVKANGKPYASDFFDLTIEPKS